MLDTPHRRTASLLAALVCLVVAGCSSLPGTRQVATMASPYKIDVVQGNVVTREQMAVLKPGMPRAAVRDVLGTPLLASVFHAQRWDYVFTLQRQGAEPQSRKVTLFFKDDVLERIEADDLPSEAEFVSTLKSTVVKGPLPVLEASEENLKKFPPAANKPAAAPSTAPATPTNYPPLEPAGK
jgi:outer membrane protein assembly factor BamE